mmetsp:Transcript_5130/g.4997  ORF Transcript_5130/g.4997 Transcript_5130/m.4997 type:complete len:114 (-) Transcript_5130:98-439(-)
MHTVNSPTTTTAGIHHHHPLSRSRTSSSSLSDSRHHYYCDDNDARDMMMRMREHRKNITFTKAPIRTTLNLLHFLARSIHSALMYVAAHAFTLYIIIPSSQTACCYILVLSMI